MFVLKQRSWVWFPSLPLFQVRVIAQTQWKCILQPRNVFNMCSTTECSVWKFLVFHCFSWEYGKKCWNSLNKLVRLVSEGSHWPQGHPLCYGAGLDSTQLGLLQSPPLLQEKGNFRRVLCIMWQDQLTAYRSSAPAALGSCVTQRWCIIIFASSDQVLHHVAHPDLHLCPVLTSLACFVLFGDDLSTFSLILSPPFLQSPGYCVSVLHVQI